MSMRRHTAQLLAARAEAYEAWKNDEGAMIRITAGAGDGVPVAHEPRSKNDSRPWAEYDPATGVEVRRYTGRQCWTVTVTDANEVVEDQMVTRSVYARLADAGITMEPHNDGGGTYARYVCADGSVITFSGTDVYGADVSNLQTIGEHAGFSAQHMGHNEDGKEYDCVASFPRNLDDLYYVATAVGRYGRDSAALIDWIVAITDVHGRAEQDYPRRLEGDEHRAKAWAERTGGSIVRLSLRNRAYDA
jgi:hypothetical protein